MNTLKPTIELTSEIEGAICQAIRRDFAKHGMDHVAINISLLRPDNPFSRRSPKFHADVRILLPAWRRVQHGIPLQPRYGANLYIRPWDVPDHLNFEKEAEEVWRGMAGRRV